eukprot:GHRQ01029067.1.p1 GENE.GHRQ01029067.1~~GHRQ01029067.1.p1  ORF type:complete len:100 (-),score=21.64 GHRQ01029067.1:87-386(-)
MAESARESAQKARNASRKLQALATEERVAMLNRVADALLAKESEIMAENSMVKSEAKFTLQLPQAAASVVLLLQLVQLQPILLRSTEGINSPIQPNMYV